MSKIMVLTGEGDPHVPALERFLSPSTAIHVLTLEEALELGYSLQVLQDPEGASLDLRVGDFTVSERDAQSWSIWLLFPNIFFYHSGAQEAHENEYHRMEVSAFFETIYRLLAGAWWLNPPGRILAAENRLSQLLAAANLGLTIPGTVVTNEAHSAKHVRSSPSGNLVLKRLGNRRVFLPPGHELVAAKVTEADLESREFVRGLNFIQEEVAAPFEVRATLVGDSVYCAKWKRDYGDPDIIDWRASTSEPHLEHHSLPEALTRRLVELLRHFGLRYAAVDLLFSPPGSYTFLELNANGQYLWIEEQLDLPITKAIADLLERQASSRTS